MIQTTKDVTLQRYWGGTATETGRWLNNGAISPTIDKHLLAIAPGWGNDMSKVANITVPAGTIMIKGVAAKQPGRFLIGGRTQYFVP